MEDYIKAYQNTGRPPFPVLQEPTDELQRKALNLPPLFQPQNPRTLGASSLSSPFKPPAIVTNTEKIVDPVKLPAGQEFRLHSSSDEKYATITCLPMYEGFSVEVCVFFRHVVPVSIIRCSRVQELRFYAYALGNKTSPTPITMDPFVQVVKEPPTGPLFGSTPTITTAGASEDKLQSLCAQPEYSRHSPEVSLPSSVYTHEHSLTCLYDITTGATSGVPPQWSRNDLC